MRIAMLVVGALMVVANVGHAAERPRAREAGVVIGTLPTGPLNAIVDVPGVRVGHATVIEGDSVRTGVTALLPHGGNLYAERVPAAIHVANSYRSEEHTSELQSIMRISYAVFCL